MSNQPFQLGVSQQQDAFTMANLLLWAEQTNLNIDSHTAVVLTRQPPF